MHHQDTNSGPEIQAVIAWHTPVIVELTGNELEGVLAVGAIGAVEEGDGCCALLEVFLGARLAGVEDGDSCEVCVEVESLSQELRSLGGAAAADGPAQQFRDAIQQAGLTPPEFIDTDGDLHRFSSDGRRGDLAGWYVFHTGDIPAGTFGCWRAGISETWQADIGRDLTDEEIAANKRKIADDKRKRREEEKRSREKARAWAAKIWDRATDATADHPYLARKGVGPHGLRLYQGELVVPVRDSAGTLHSVQRIAADGFKHFLLHGRKNGCHFTLGEPSGLLVVCEGFATGASIREDTGHAVAIAFDAGNLLPAAKDLRAKYRDLRFIFCADDDVTKPDNPGLTKAREAAAAVGGGFLAVPDFGQNRPDKATDFNDLHRHAGPEAVRACIELAARPEPPRGNWDASGEKSFKEERRETPFVRKFKGGGTFIREYVPISYTLDRVLPSGVLYFLTARRGTGKTAWLLAVLFAVGLGRPEIIGVDVEKGHVAFICLENPADVRMKMAVYAWRYNVPLNDLDVCLTVIDGRLSVREIVEQLAVACEEKGPLQLVGYDTFQAGFGTSASKGQDFNTNAPVLNFAQELRGLLDLPGRPSVLVLAHPCKSAGEADLIPYGGGATANEYDGNLTLWAEGGIIKFHWLDKLRGPEFKPIYYKTEQISSPGILDTKGRQIRLPVCVPLDEKAVEQRQKAKGATNVEIMKAMHADLKGSQRQWAAAANVKEATLRDRLKVMERDKLIRKRKLDDRYEITPLGMKELLQVVPEEAPE